ncbi:Bgt-20206, partial [Blumeria graminis f. sp. tritici]
TVEKRFKDIDNRLDNIDSNLESLGSSLASIKQALDHLSNNRTPRKNTEPEYDYEPPSLQAQEALRQQEIKAKARLPDGKFNIHYVPQEEAPRPHNLGEKYVQEIWPEVKLRKQIIALG